jgi:hypothetical protein
MIAVGAVAGIYTVQRGSLAMILSGLVLAASFFLLKAVRENILGNYRWIPYAWMALSLAPDLRFTFRSTLDNSVSSASPENYAQVAVYMLVAVLVLHGRRLLVNRDRTDIRKGPLLAWPVIALASTVWSLIPLFTFVRALQLLVPIGLAVLMVRIWLASPEVAATIWRDTFRLFVRVVTVLILVGCAAGFWRDRFTWPGAQSGVAALYVGVGLIILIACGRTFLGLRRTGYVSRLVLFGAALYLGETRSVVGAVVLAMGVLFWWTARTKPFKSYLGISYYAIAIVLVLFSAWSQILEYALRGGTSAGFASLDGRIPLWAKSFDLLSTTDRWFIGFGYGSPRVFLPTIASWAGTAHSSWMELLLGIGILGPILAAADILFVMWYAASRDALVPPALTLSILTLLLVTSVTGEGLALPSASFAMLALLHAPILAERNLAVRRVRARSGAPLGKQYLLEGQAAPYADHHLRPTV